MPFKFNIFTGNLDVVNAPPDQYIDGDVEYHADLPVTVGTPAVNSAYLVRKGQGLYFLTRKPAGIWVRELNNGNLNDWKYAGTFSDLYRDANFRIINDTDTSKELAFSLSGISTGQTRTLTVADGNGTISVLPTITSLTLSGTHQLTAARNQRVRVNSTNATSGSVIYLPSTGTAEGDRLEVACVGLTSGTLSVRTGQYDFTVSASMGLNEQRTFIYSAGAWTLGSVESHTHTGLGPTFASSAFRVTEPSGIATNVLAFSLSSITAGATRTLTVPNSSGTIALNETFAAPPAIGNTTANSGAFTTLTANNGTLTASAPALNIEQTWNGAGVIFVAAQINAIRASGSSSSADSELLRLSENGTEVFRFRRTGQIVASTITLTATAGNVVIGGNLNIGGSNLILTQDAADTLAQRRTTNPQTFRVYGTLTGTDVSATGNYERGFMRWSAAGGTFQIGTEKGSGGGLARGIALQVDGTTRFQITSTGALALGSVITVWENTAGMYISSNTASINFNNGLGIGNNEGITAGSGGRFRWKDNVLYTSGSYDLGFQRNSAGVLEINNGTAGTFRDVVVRTLDVGGTTNAFPALKNSSTTLQVRLADDSAFAPLSASTITSTDSTANTSSIAASGYGLTGSSAVSMVDLTGIWDTTGSPTLIKANVTDTASNAGSLLLDLQAGGTSRFSVSKNAGAFFLQNTFEQRNSTNAQEARVYGSYTSETNFQRTSVKTVRESTGALSGADYTTTIAIPAYSYLIGVTTRVTTVITGATSYDVGDGTDVDLWGAAIAAAEGSQSRTANFTNIAAVGPAGTSRTVKLTANGGSFTAGVVEICLHYLTTEAD